MSKIQELIDSKEQRFKAAEESVQNNGNQVYLVFILLNTKSFHLKLITFLIC